MFSTIIFTIYSLFKPIELISHNTGKVMPAVTYIAPGVYQHYKGSCYLVLFTSMHTETEEEMVVYQSLKDFRIWSRPLQMFIDEVEYEGIKQPRFNKIADSNEAERFIT